MQAAITVCLGDPDRKAVHTLRGEIRRIQAQIALLALLPAIPPLQDSPERALRQLRRLGRGAGAVSDLDVQREMVGDLAKSLEGAAKRRVPNPVTAQHDLARLQRWLKKRRFSAAEKLQRTLEKRLASASRALELLLDNLRPVQSLELPAAETLATVDAGFAHRGHEAAAETDPIERLHTLRKAAKVARYQAESIHASTLATTAAARYERLQDAGGLWHDWLELTDIFSTQLKRGNPLIPLAEHKTAIARRAFERLLLRSGLLPLQAASGNRVMPSPSKRMAPPHAA